MEGKNIWRLCKTYGRLIGYPMLKPHDLRHGVAMGVYEHHHDLEEVRGLLGHTRLETTQLYAQIRPAALPPNVVAEFTERGGHVGFIEGPPWRPRAWAERRAMDFLASVLAADVC